MKIKMFIFSFCFPVFLNAQSTQYNAFVFDGINRNYSFYVPASYTQGQPVPLVLDLHGLTSNGAQQALYSNFKPIADTAGFIVAHPDGTLDPIFSQHFWNIGVFSSTVVDDVAFLEALIDTISAHYSINPRRIYCTGMSNGGYMSFYMACNSNRFAAIGSVTGSMTASMYNNCSPSSYPMPVIQIHGTADSTVPYAGNSTSRSIADVIAYWVNINGCDTMPVATQVPDINQTDNSTAVHYLYSNGTDGHTIEHFKVINGGHTWPGSIPLPSNGNTCLDFSASKEIWRFFSQYQLPVTASLNKKPDVKLRLWPNPTNGYLHLSSGKLNITNVTVFDLTGRIVFEKSGNHIQYVNLTNLHHGNYFVRISGGNFAAVKQVIVLQN